MSGGFREVLYAYELAIQQINQSLITKYAQNTSLATCKRLVWIFEALKVFPESQKILAELPMDYPQRLDPTGERQGAIHKRWPGTGEYFLWI